MRKRGASPAARVREDLKPLASDYQTNSFSCPREDKARFASLPTSVSFPAAGRSHVSPLTPPSAGSSMPHPWKLPGTVILRFTSAFMTRLTIS